MRLGDQFNYRTANSTDGKRVITWDSFARLKLVIPLVLANSEGDYDSAALTV